jgi:2-C-methyl-D-erythritol 2,4-cyclodiphosphate synthase
MSTTFHIGHGYDIHRLRSGGELRMGGVVVSREMTAVAHSDGDVVIHAIVDALLGAAGLGDIGEHFPDSDVKWKGVESVVFLREVQRKLLAGGWGVVNVDVTIMAERPRLKDFKREMIENLRSILGCDINIKAGTNEGCDAVGRGEAVAAHAVVLIQRGS